MFIQTEPTPNPATLKFIPDGNIVLEGSETIEFKNEQQAANQSPLALQIFQISGVKSIFFAHDFITITKSDEAKWSEIKTEIMATIMDFYVSKKEVMFASPNKEEDEAAEAKTASDEIDDEIVKQIKELIEIKVRPAVAMDGGDIIYRDFKDGIVFLELKGSCSGCPSSTITLKNGIENMLKHYIPEVVAVEQIFED